MSWYSENIERDGFVILPSFLDAATVDRLRDQLANVKADDASSSRAGKAFGIRNLLKVMPAARDLANSHAMRLLVEPVLGNCAKVVRGVYFDKHKDANWKVAWHQDLTIAVSTRQEVEGYGPWSLKAGIQHVQPPVSILENMLTVRVHLDLTDESNGLLRVFPGSHRQGRMNTETIEKWKDQRTDTICSVNSGGAMLMRPLLLHASSAAAIPRHRRVLHFEYCSSALAAGLEWYEVEAAL
jgi:ectoine hydroxylase-related dioxygenase (phytanoyl-CoA dioxygenase family)